jgi:hypothetical protein
MKTTKILTVIAILQALTLVSVWRGGVDGASPAHADSSSLPDPGADRRQTIAQLHDLNDKAAATNDHLVELIKLMQSGKVQVLTTPAR